MNAMTQMKLESSISLAAVMSRTERLTRWADLIDKKVSYPRAIGLYGFEYGDKIERLDHTCEAFQIAFNDPLLRSDGLKGYTVLDIKQFFGLNDKMIHEAFCECGMATSVSVRADLKRYANAGPVARFFQRIFG